MIHHCSPFLVSISIVVCDECAELLVYLLRIMWHRTTRRDAP
ncbi:Hypothetical protein RY67_1295 [Bifidobacterium longum subsp. infantis]|uniref:Uncharacterized protein n=1 Tax=Bifidobacterium longum subsp. infantis TaxID=1682 RepID=A0A0M4LUF3_BIFLI|nr:Hypothetical protein RY67_1295 [Bifidobacterium longum subsp. infantis]